MCYQVDDFDWGIIQRSIDYAFGDAGLDVSQIQFGIYGGAPAHGGPSATLGFLAKAMQPKRISMIHYQVPPDAEHAKTALMHVKDFEAALNPGCKGPGESGAPLQVPRG